VAAFLLLAVLPQGIDPPADSLPPDLPGISYHLTARPWKPLGIPTSAYLDRIEGECRLWTKHQDSTGAVRAALGVVDV